MIGNLSAVSTVSSNTTPFKQPPSSPYNHAVVIGSGIAGLIIARTLSDYFKRVTIIERDLRNDEPAYRRGTPQARHTHTLQPRAQTILENLFPGLMEELTANGAVAIDAQKDIAFFEEGSWRTTRRRSTNIAASRTLLECLMYQHVMANPKIRIVRGVQVENLLVDESGARVTGVKLRRRPGSTTRKTEIRASVVFDTSGRASKAPQWLENLGFTPPEEWRVNSFVGYTTRIYQQPENDGKPWKTLYIRPTAPDQTRGGLIAPMENGRWSVTLIGVAGDFPPTDEEGFMDFARSLPAPELYEAITNAEPLSKPFGFQRTENRVRCYHWLPRYLEGFMVGGDAAIALNPMYAQGMTAAAHAGQALAETLARHKAEQPHTIDGLAADFQQALHKAASRLWQMATTHDWHWPLTEVTDSEDDRGN